LLTLTLLQIFASDDGTLIKTIDVQRKQPAENNLVKQVLFYYIIFYFIIININTIVNYKINHIAQTKAKTTTLEASSIPPPHVVEGKKKRKTEISIASIDSKKIACILA
jgi:hypothetical protein